MGSQSGSKSESVCMLLTDVHTVSTPVSLIST